MKVVLCPPALFKQFGTLVMGISPAGVLNPAFPSPQLPTSLRALHKARLICTGPNLEVNFLILLRILKKKS